MTNNFGDRYKKFVNWFGQPSHLFIVMIGLCIVLVFTLGGTIIQYSTNQNLSREVVALKGQNEELRSEVTALEKRNSLADLAAYKACIATRPKARLLVSSLAKFYSNQADTVFDLLKMTYQGTAAYKARLQNYNNDVVLAGTLKDLLKGIQCHKPDGDKR